jgi:hypothetical protein
VMCNVSPPTKLGPHFVFVELFFLVAKLGYRRKLAASLDR